MLGVKVLAWIIEPTTLRSEPRSLLIIPVNRCPTNGLHNRAGRVRSNPPVISPLLLAADDRGGSGRGQCAAQPGQV